MRFLMTLAAALAALTAAPALAQDDPIAASVEAMRNYDSDSAVEVLSAACTAGNTEACWRLALVLDQSYGESENAKKQFLANCAQKDARSCYMFAQGLDYEATDKQKTQARNAMIKACDLGLVFACTEVPEMLPGSEGDEAEIQGEIAANVYYDKACTLGSMSACHDAAALFQRGSADNNPRYDTARAIAYERKACDGGEPEACAALPDLEQSAMPGDTEITPELRRRWLSYREKACKLGGGFQCREWLAYQVYVP